MCSHIDVFLSLLNQFSNIFKKYYIHPNDNVRDGENPQGHLTNAMISSEESIQIDPEFNFRF